MDSRLKLKLSRMFRSSFGSCKPKNLTDEMENPIFIAQNRLDFQKIEPFSPKVRPFPSICKPKLPELMEIEKNSSLSISQRKKITDRGACFVSGDTEGRACPPASPSSPSNLTNLFFNFHDYETRERKTKPKKSRKPNKKNKRKDSCRLSSSSDNGGWFSSEDEIEDETETFFSSRSFSSDSSESLRRKKNNSRRKRAEARRRRALSKNSDVGLLDQKNSDVGIAESFAVVKRSSDPHSDFRTSMVEMIIEKQIFAAEDLEKLLQCFLTLNSSHHHRVIVQVFTEIWDALFSYCRFEV